MRTPTINSREPKTTDPACKFLAPFSGFHFGSTIKVDGELVRPFLNPTASLGFATLPHAAGVVDVVVSNPDGEARLRGGFAYAAPETLNFNGEWNGSADGPAETLPDMSFTIANNSLVRISCGSVTLTPSPAPSVRGGEFSFAGDDGLALSGRMLSTSTAVGEIRVPPCGPGWFAKKQ